MCTSLTHVSSVAIAARSFAEAAKLRDLGAGLVGWWAGRHEPRDPTEEADPHGCILRVTPAPGRFLGSMYAVRDLVGSQGGVPDLEAGYPVLELFVQRDASTGKEQFKLQPVAVYGASTDMGASRPLGSRVARIILPGPTVPLLTDSKRSPRTLQISLIASRTLSVLPQWAGPR